MDILRTTVVPYPTEDVVDRLILKSPTEAISNTSSISKTSVSKTPKVPTNIKFTMEL